MKKSLASCLWLGLVLSTLVALKAAAADEPSFTGRITLKGEPPPEIAIEMDAQSMKLQRKQPMTRFYVVGPGRGLADVFVYIRDKIPGPFREPKGPVTMRIAGAQYMPQLAGIRTGQVLQIFNDDPFMHNVMCMRPNGGDWNKAMVNNAMPVEARFNERELFVRFKCDVHPWEYGYVCAMEHPFFAVTGPDGRFAFPPGMPDGTFTVEAIHRKAGKFQREVTFENDSAPPLEFAFEVKPPEPRVAETEPTAPAIPEIPPPTPASSPEAIVHSIPGPLTNDVALAMPVEPDDSKSRWLIAAVLFALAIVFYRASKD